MSNFKTRRYLIPGLTILSLLLSGGCVYFNTFFNARKAFNEAENTRRESSGGTNINTAKYNLAIEKSLKVVENYPNSKYYDDALYVLSVSYYYTDKHQRAERRLRELIANYPKSEYVAESELYLAKTKLKMNEESEAMVIFQTIFDSDYGKSLKTEAAMALGRYYFNNENYADAQRFFRAVRDSLGANAENKKLAQQFIADGNFNLFMFHDALGDYLQLLGMDANKYERLYALSQAAQCAFRVSRIGDGLEYLNTLIKDERYFDSVSVLKMRLAGGYELSGDVAQAEQLYREVGETENVKKTAAEAYYHLGLIYQFDYDDLPEAKKFYDTSVELSQSSEAGKASLQHSSDIGKLDKFSQAVKIDSTSSQEVVDEAAYTQYQLAELYWLNLNKPDSAIAEMRYMVDSFPGAYDTPKGMIALAEMIRETYSDTVTADSILNEVLLRHPHSDYVPEALAALRMTGTAADTGYAQLYLKRAEDFLVDDSNLDSARYYYRYVIENFPESRFYPQARFSLIWIDEQYNNPGDSSIVYAYREFMDSFPNTLWAEEAGKIVQATPKKFADAVVLGDSTGQEEDSLGLEGADGRRSDEDSVEYIDPLEAVYVGPNGERIPLMKDPPIETREPFEYPTDAYRTGYEGEIYFQILLDFSGDVVDYALKIRSGVDEIDNEAMKTVASMTFDPQKIPIQLQDSWFVYKMIITKPENLR